MCCACVPPRTATVVRRSPRLFFRKSSCHQAFRTGICAFPLSPEDDVESTANPFVQSLEDTAYLCQGEIVHPPDQGQLHLLNDSLQTLSLSPPKNVFHLRFQPRFRVLQQAYEPPYTEPYVRWCERTEDVNSSPTRFISFVRRVEKGGKR